MILDEVGDGHLPARQVPHRRRPADAPLEENAHFKTVVMDARSDEPVVPNGSLGHRFGDSRRRAGGTSTSTASTPP